MKKLVQADCVSFRYFLIRYPEYWNLGFNESR